MSRPLSDTVFSRSVSILFRKNLNVDIINHHQSVNCRNLLFKVKFDEKVFSLVNVYALNFKKEKTAIRIKMASLVNTNTCKLFICERK